MMKIGLFAPIFALGLLLNGCSPDRVVGAVELSPQKAQVVIAPMASPVVCFAADEMTNFLARVLGAPVPIANAPAPDRINLVLGENEWSAAKGLLPEKQLAADGFYILPDENNVYIVGHDDPKANIRQALREARAPQRGSRFHRATLFAVYDFLERYAGCRFYFTGADDLGIITPRQATVTIPAKKIVEQPYFDVVRRWTSPGAPQLGVGDTTAFSGYEAKRPIESVRNNLLNMYRLRMKAVEVPCAHGAAYMELQQRFGKTHPEYFALLKTPKGKMVRDVSPVETDHQPCQLCWSSGVTDEILKDAIAYARGDDPTTRGFTNGYPPEALDGRFLCFMPQDGYRPCQCEKCRTVTEKALAEERQPAGALVHAATAKVAQGLLDAGVDLTILAAAYTSYSEMPAFGIPSNVVMIVVRTGPWALADPARHEKEIKDIVDWSKKTGQRVSLHNWTCKYSHSKIPGLPSMTPKAIGQYYEKVSPYVRGTYMESSSERFSHIYQNLYVFSKMAWNPEFDWRAALDEHDRLMFGAGAKPMRKMFDTFEELWMRMVNRVIETNMGTIVMPPTPNDIWGSIYSADVVAQLHSLAKEAYGAAGPDTLEGRRVKLLAGDLLGALEYERNAYLDACDVRREKAYRDACKSPNLLADIAVREFHFACAGGGDDGKMKTSYSHPITLRPNTRYRLSAIVKFKDVVPKGKMGGLWVAFWDTHNSKYFCANRPVGGLKGSSDWMAIANEFTTLKNAEIPELWLRLRDATGEAWIRDVRLEVVEQ